jgi:hypothetical protein
MATKEKTTIRLDLGSAEVAVSKVITRIDAAWREKKFEGLEACFHPEAVITGPGFAEMARGRAACVESYREFATNAEVLAYSEANHQLRVWKSTAVYTFAWRMSFQRGEGPVHEKGTDQMVFQKGQDGWQVVWRYVHFESVE